MVHGLRRGEAMTADFRGDRRDIIVDPRMKAGPAYGGLTSSAGSWSWRVWLKMRIGVGHFMNLRKQNEIATLHKLNEIENIC